MAELIDTSAITDLLAGGKTIAVLGASTDPGRAGYYVPEYLHAAGLRVIPVNPTHAGETLFGEAFRHTLAEIGERIDIVDVFRRPDQVMSHLDDFLACRPGAVWLQSGIWSDALREALEGTGIDLVQDRCMMVDHRRFVRAR